MALTLGAGGVALEGPAAAEDEDARGEVDCKGGGARKDGVDAEADEGETTGSVGGTFGGGALGGVTGWALPPAAALGGGSTRARFAGREGLVNENVDTVFLGPCVGSVTGPTAAAGAGRFRRSAAVRRWPVARMIWT